MSHNHSSDTTSAEGFDDPAAIAVLPSFVRVAVLAGRDALVVLTWEHPGRVQIPLPSHFPHNHVV